MQINSFTSPSALFKDIPRYSERFIGLQIRPAYYGEEKSLWPYWELNLQTPGRLAHTTVTMNCLLNQSRSSQEPVKLCGCFGNMRTCIYRVLYCLYCVFVVFCLCIFIFIYFPHSTHKRPPPVPILNQLHPVPTTPSHFPNIHFNPAPIPWGLCDLSPL